MISLRSNKDEILRKIKDYEDSTLFLNVNSTEPLQNNAISSAINENQKIKKINLGLSNINMSDCIDEVANIIKAVDGNVVQLTLLNCIFTSVELNKLKQSLGSKKIVGRFSFDDIKRTATDYNDVIKLIKDIFDGNEFYFSSENITPDEVLKLSDILLEKKNIFDLCLMNCDASKAYKNIIEHCHANRVYLKNIKLNTEILNTEIDLLETIQKNPNLLSLHISLKKEKVLDFHVDIEKLASSPLVELHVSNKNWDSQFLIEKFNENIQNEKAQNLLEQTCWARRTFVREEPQLKIYANRVKRLFEEYSENAKSYEVIKNLWLDTERDEMTLHIGVRNYTR